MKDFGATGVPRSRTGRFCTGVMLNTILGSFWRDGWRISRCSERFRVCIWNLNLNRRGNCPNQGMVCNMFRRCCNVYTIRRSCEAGDYPRGNSVVGLFAAFHISRVNNTRDCLHACFPALNFVRFRTR